MTSTMNFLPVHNLQSNIPVSTQVNEPLTVRLASGLDDLMKSLCVTDDNLFNQHDIIKSVVPPLLKDTIIELASSGKLSTWGRLKAEFLNRLNAGVVPNDDSEALLNEDTLANIIEHQIDQVKHEARWMSQTDIQELESHKNTLKGELEEAVLNWLVNDSVNK